MPNKTQQASAKNEPEEAGAGESALSQLDEAAVKELVEVLHFVSAAKDAMSDDMVERLAGMASESIVVLDRLTRNEGVLRLLGVLNRPESQYLLMSLADAIDKMSREVSEMPPAKGGVRSLWQIAREPGTQEGLRAVSLLGKYWNEALRDLHRKGG